MHIKDKIPNDLQKQYLNWLHITPQNIFYTNVKLSEGSEFIKSISQTTGWILVMSFLSKFYGFQNEFRSEIEHLINMQENGLWDFGKALASYKLSDSWIVNINRKIDHSAYIFGILSSP